MMKFILFLSLLNYPLLAWAEESHETLKEEIKLLKEKNRLLKENAELQKQQEPVPSKLEKADHQYIDQEDIDPDAPENNLESWYAFWGIGASHNISFSDDRVNSYLGNFQSEVDRTSSMTMDILGFYWPLFNQKTILGFVLNSQLSRYGDGKTQNSETATRLLSNLGLSSMYFFGPFIGKGFFLRADLGFSYLKLAKLDSNDNETVFVDNMGPGAVLGFGYGFPVSTKARLLLYFNYSNFTAGSGRAEMISTNVGLLF